MKDAIRYEFKTMINKRGFCVSFLVMLAFSVFSFGVVAVRSFAAEATQVLAADSCFMGNYYSPTWYFFLYIFSFIVVLPHAMSYIEDLETGVYSLAIIRTGKVQYFLSKMFAAFWGNFIIIAIPFIFNLLLCHLTFSQKPNYPFGEYGLPNYFTTLLGTGYIFSSKQSEIPFLSVYLVSSTLYNILYIFILSMTSGFLGVFLLSFSFLCCRKRAYLFAPVYLLMLASSVITEYAYSRAVSNSEIEFINYNLMDYLAVFGYPGKSLTYVSILFLFGVSFILIASIKVIRNDQLLVVSHEKE